MGLAAFSFRLGHLATSVLKFIPKEFYSLPTAYLSGTASTSPYWLYEVIKKPLHIKPSAYAFN